jgi:hypothetical protein
VGLSATGLPPRSSPDPGAGTRVALAHGAIGIRDNYISSARRCRRVRKLLATRSCTEGVTCDTAALDCSSKLPPWPQHSTTSALDHRQVNLRGHSAFAKSTAHTALLLSPRNREGSTGFCHHTIHSTSPAGTRALHATRRKIDHAAQPLLRPPLGYKIWAVPCAVHNGRHASPRTSEPRAPCCKIGESTPVCPLESSYPGRLVNVPGARIILRSLRASP